MLPDMVKTVPDSLVVVVARAAMSRNEVIESITSEKKLIGLRNA